MNTMENTAQGEGLIAPVVPDDERLELAKETHSRKKPRELAEQTHLEQKLVVVEDHVKKGVEKLSNGITIERF